MVIDRHNKDAIKRLIEHGFQPASNCFVAAAVIGAGVVTAGVGAAASKSAASTEAGAGETAAGDSLEATQETNQLNYEIYEQNLANLSPQMQAQQEAEAALTSGLGLAPINTGSTQMSGGVNSTAAGATPTGGNSNTFQATSTGTPTGVSPQPNGSVLASGGLGGSGIPLSMAGGTSPLTGTQGGNTNVAPLNTSFNPNGLPTSSPGTSSGTTGINGLSSNDTLLTPGATSSQLTSSGASQPSGSLLAGFNNTDLNNQLAPSYGFILGQGQTSNANYNAAHGITGGNATNSEEAYTENTASTYYQQAFQNYLTQQQQNISSLSSLAGNGATTTATGAGTSAGSTIASSTAAGVGASTNYLTGAASATAAGTVGEANALSGAVGSATSGYFTNQLIQNQLNNNTPLTTVAPATGTGPGLAGTYGGQ